MLQDYRRFRRAAVYLSCLILALFCRAQDYPQAEDPTGAELFAEAAQDPFSFWIPDPTPGASSAPEVADEDATPPSPTETAPSQDTAPGPDAVSGYDSGPIVYGYINGVYLPLPYGYRPYYRHGYGYPYPNYPHNTTGSYVNGNRQNYPAARGAVNVGPAYQNQNAAPAQQQQQRHP